TLRTQSPIAGNPDGLNFLRIARTQPFAFHYWEVGNEVYTNNETDEHGQVGDALPMPAAATAATHDPTTYISFAKQFAALAAQIDPTIAIGVDSQTTSSQFNNWIRNMLAQCVAQGFAPNYISDHLYPQQPGLENDAALLSDPSRQVSPTPANPFDLVQRAQVYRGIINSAGFSPAQANGIQLLITELNSVSSLPGKQSTSIVNGLYIADVLGQMMQTEYNGAWIWDLHNGPPSTAGNAASSLYGWRSVGDYGIIANGNGAGAANNVQYPDYFAEQLVSKMIQPGGSVVQVSSDDPNLDSFAVRGANGHLSLLVINKSAAGLKLDASGPNNPSSPYPSITATFQLSGFIPGDSAQIWQYGSIEDTQQQNSATQIPLNHFTQALSLSASSFSLSFPNYSMTVVDLTPAPPQIVSGNYPWNVAGNRIQFTFNQDMNPASFLTGNLSLTNQDGGPVPTVSSVSYDAPSKTVTFFLSGTPHDDNYSATLLSGSGSALVGGAATASPFSFNFFALAGDTDHDRDVDNAD
ncbi:MAG TPA: hypothetical protein VKK61_11450, partial [Tepidisphaeraceae bacterium]|nr:hypothetical protein [Tepidisphaeraceae bacterium]